MSRRRKNSKTIRLPYPNQLDHIRFLLDDTELPQGRICEHALDHYAEFLSHLYKGDLKIRANAVLKRFVTDLRTLQKEAADHDQRLRLTFKNQTWV